MARTYSLNVLSDLTTPEGKMFLKELYGVVIANVQNESTVTDLKNTQLSGDVAAGSVEAKRFQNATSKEYGAARTAGAGEAVKGRPVTVNLDTDREFVEELEEKDTRMLGVEGLIRQRAAEHQSGMVWELEEAFYNCAKTEGVAYTASSTATHVKDIIEAAVVQLSKTNNKYIRGIKRGLMKIVCNPEVYSEMRDYLDTLQNSNVASDVEKFRAFHGVQIEECINLPGETTTGAGDDIKFVLMMKQSIAQPVHSTVYSAEKIPQSNAYSVQLFYTYGTRAVTPETILYWDGTTDATTNKKAEDKKASK